MKKTRYIIALVAAMFAVGAMLFVACGKDEEVLGDSVLQGEISKSNLLDIVLQGNTQDLLSLIDNPEDPDDEKINRYSYFLAMSLEDLVQDENFNQDVINLAKKSPVQSADLIDLFESHPDYEIIVNKKLEQFNISFNEIASDFTHRYPWTDAVEYYRPSIYVPNVEKLDVQEMPIISPGLDINCDENEELEDFIAVWIWDSKGVRHDFMMGEKHSTQTKHPLFFIDNTSLGAVNSVCVVDFSDDFDGTIEDYDNGNCAEFHLYDFVLKERYEKSGKSEYAISAVVFDRDYHFGWLYNPDGTKKVAKVSKNDVQNQVAQYKWDFFFWDMYYPYKIRCRYSVLWNTYEYDWAKSSKNIGWVNNSNFPGERLIITGKCKYENDTYAFDRSSCELFTSDEMNYVYDNWAKWYGASRNKGLTRIWRVHPSNHTTINLPYYYF